MKTRKSRHDQEVSLKGLNITFLLRIIMFRIKRSFRRFIKTIPVIFEESRKIVKEQGWKHAVRIHYHKDEFEGKRWELKIMFFILITDIYHCTAYKEWNDKIFPAHYGCHLWLNSWKIVKLWGSCGTNCAELFHWCSSKRIYQTNLLKKLNPIKFLKRIVILQRIEETDRMYVSICNDPMNGCPEDFAEEGDRVSNHLWSLYYELQR